MTSPTEPIAPAASDIVLGTAAGRRPTLTLDVALYESYLEDAALSEDDRRAVLEALWTVIVGFVDLGFAVEPAAPSDEAQSKVDEEFASADADLVEYSARSTTNQFEKAAAHLSPPGH